MPGFFQCYLSDRQHLQADQCAREIKAVHDLHKAFAFFPQQMVRWYFDIFKKQRAATYGALTMAIKSRARYAGQRHRHQDS